MSSTDWQETTYRETYESEIRGLQRRLASDPSLTAEDFKGILKSLYILDGSDWQGRGEVQTITLSAVISAYEDIIAGFGS